MSDTTYQDYNQNNPVVAAWLNDVNILAYRVCGTGGVVPTTVAQLQANLGIATPTNVAASIAAAFASPPALGATAPAAVNATSGTFSGNVTTATLTPAAIVGRTTAPGVGQIGEVINVNLGSTSLSTGTPATVATLPLTAGVWEVTGNVVFTFSAPASALAVYAGANTTTNVLPAASLYSATVTTGFGAPSLIVPTQRFTETGAANIFVVAQGNFSGGTCSASAGFIRAVRVA